MTNTATKLIIDDKTIIEYNNIKDNNNRKKITKKNQGAIHKE